MRADECVQGAPRLIWRKSSYSSEEGGECVEVAPCPETVHVRDSKDRTRPPLHVSPQSWMTFIGFAAQGPR
ncbi:DUF397 domain-containing protein [Streptomyces sp. NPDC055189]